MGNLKRKGKLILRILVTTILLVTFGLVFSIGAGKYARAGETNRNEIEDLIWRGHNLRIEGNTAEKEGKHEEAAALYKEAISLYDKAKTLDEDALGYNDYIDLAACYRGLKQYDKVIDTVEEGIKRIGASGEADDLKQLYISQLHLYLAEIYKEIKEFDKALNIYESQRPNGENDSGWYYGLADCYIQMEDTIKAKEVYESAFDRLVFDELLYSKVVDFYIKNDFLDDAEAITYKAIVVLKDEPPFIPMAYENLLTIYEKQGRSEDTLNWTMMRLEEAEEKAEEYWEQQTPTEQKYHNALTWFIIICSGIFMVILIIIVFLVRRHRRRKFPDGDS